MRLPRFGARASVVDALGSKCVLCRNEEVCCSHNTTSTKHSAYLTSSNGFQLTLMGLGIHTDCHPSARTSPNRGPNMPYCSSCGLNNHRHKQRHPMALCFGAFKPCGLFVFLWMAILRMIMFLSWIKQTLDWWKPKRPSNNSFHQRQQHLQISGLH